MKSMFLCSTEGFMPSRPLQLTSVKYKKDMNVCLPSYSIMFMPNMKCKKNVNVCPLSELLCFSYFSRDAYLCNL
jgi:hypothetical protein